MKRLLLVDDERLPMAPYEKALTMCHFEIERFYGVDETLLFARSQPRAIDGMILDCLMPPGEAFKQMDTARGLKTGIYLYNELRKIYQNKPTILLTNVSGVVELGKLQGSNPFVKVTQKLQTPPFALAELVIQHIENCSGIISASKDEQQEKLISTKIWDSNLEERYRTLMRQEATASLSVEGLQELEGLAQLRRELVYPRSEEEVMLERKRHLALENLVEAIENYVRTSEL